MSIINNIGYLRKDLIDHGYHMTAFLFTYKNTDYDVLFENNENIENRKNPFASVLLTFIDINNPNRTLTVECNQVKMFFKPKEIREFFGIEYGPNLGDVFNQFFQRLVNATPDRLPVLNNRQNNAVDRCLAGRGGHDPNAIYCYDARRLGKRDGRQMERSIFISNLTKRRRPILFDYFENEITVTFYFSPNLIDELTDEEIIRKFRLREDERRRA